MGSLLPPCLAQDKNPRTASTEGQPGTALTLSRCPHVSINSLQVYELATSMSLVFFQLNCPSQVLWYLLACFTSQDQAGCWDQT